MSEIFGFLCMVTFICQLSSSSSKFRDLSWNNIFLFFKFLSLSWNNSHIFFFFKISSLSWNNIFFFSFFLQKFIEFIVAVPPNRAAPDFPSNRSRHRNHRRKKTKYNEKNERKNENEDSLSFDPTEVRIMNFFLQVEQFEELFWAFEYGFFLFYIEVYIRYFMLHKAKNGEFIQRI